ncbi:VOC family protein [Catelliglobosispora koreensis]|uniref:VOC family protein n=1 Tax=Catelliglobosispora koreensis TaxID=129052 RepID=UPI00035DBC94|nr:VOC family protein [Catelliglobosispora koreensis]
MGLQLNAIALFVADLERAISFYELLGLKFTGEGPHRDAELSGGMRLMLDEHDMVKALIPGWETPTGSARVAFAFECRGPAEVDKHYASLTAAGAQSVKEPYDAPWGQRYATVSDPDGNLIDLYAPQ